MNRTFRKGTDYKSLIKGIARQSGIKISKIDLAKNPKLKRAFTAKGKPLNLLKQVVKKTGSSMTYIRGKLEIINPKRAKRTWFEITDQDLIQPPSSEENDGKRTWEIEIPLVPEITTFVGITMKSKYLKGKYYVKAGHHSFDMESAKTQCRFSKDLGGIKWLKDNQKKKRHGIRRFKSCSGRLNLNYKLALLQK